MAKVDLVLGPPGTGKTTTLLDRIERHIESLVRPDRIAFVSFTKAACREAKERACLRFGFEDDDLPYFQTIHSLAFKMAGGRRAGEVMAERHWKQFGEACTYSFTEDRQSDLPFFASFTTSGDQLRAVYDMSRLRLCTIEQALLHMQAEGVRVNAEHVRAYVARLLAFKKEMNLIDYTDMLELALRSPQKPSVDRAFVDETQDLCALQLALIDHWFFKSEVCDEITLAGDDDQAIYTWAGAEPDWLIQAERRYPSEKLGQSWRMPSAVHPFAMSIIRQNRNRIEKPYRPKNESGSIIVARNIEDAIESDGPVMVLVRNNYLAERFYDHAMSHGMLFRSEVGNKAPLDLVGPRGAYRALASLRANMAMLPGHFIDLLDLVPSRVGKQQLLPHGVKSRAAANEQQVSLDRARTEFGLGEWLAPILTSDRPCFLALLKLEEDQRLYLDRVMARVGPFIPEEIPLTITNQHRCKGRESHTVVIASDMARRSHSALIRGDESEHRLAYVAATRTKQNLRLLRPETGRHYPYQSFLKAANGG